MDGWGLRTCSSSWIAKAAGASVGGGSSAKMLESSAKFSRTLSVCRLSLGILRRIIFIGTWGPTMKPLLTTTPSPQPAGAAGGWDGEAGGVRSLVDSEKW